MKKQMALYSPVPTLPALRDMSGGWTVTFEHVSKQFDQLAGNTLRAVTALENLSLKVASGDVLAVLGPSGCGKSTLLRLAAGLIEPDSGGILYDNTPLRDVPLRERGVGMVFQDGALMPHWEARRSVGFFLWLRKREYEVPARVARISQITGFGLETLLGRLPSQLSGGERQRVAVARALARDPRLFLFDEPFSNIDAKLRATARVELKRLLHEFPVTSVYVTHDQTEATALAHRIAVMRAGKIEQVGTYHSLYANPVNQFVALFIGAASINLFRGYVRDKHWYGDNFGGYPIRRDLPDGMRVILGIRPEYVHLAPEGIRATVESVTPFYGERHQLVEVRGGGERWSLMLPLRERIVLRQTIYCALDGEGMLYFDPKTGARIG